MRSPEEEQAAARRVAARKFVDEMLAEVRARLFKGTPEKEWFEHLATVRLACMDPSKWMQERGAALPAERYREILRIVVAGIERHGDLARIRRMAIYFRHAVQEHMKHNGPRYYEQEGKAGRAVAGLVRDVMGKLTPRQEARATTAALASAHEVLADKRLGRRKPRQSSGGTQRELF